MRLLRSCCCLLLCVCILSAPFSVGASATVDGYTVITKFAENGSYVEFNDTVVTKTAQDGDLYITIDVALNEYIEKDTVFNAKVGFSAATANSFTVAYLAMYDKTNKLISSTQNVTVEDGVIEAQDVQADGNVYSLQFLLKISSPFWIVEVEKNDPIYFMINGFELGALELDTWSTWLESVSNTPPLYQVQTGVACEHNVFLKVSDGGANVALSDTVIPDNNYYLNCETCDNEIYNPYSPTMIYNSYTLPNIDDVWNKTNYDYALITHLNGMFYLYLFNKVGSITSSNLVTVTNSVQVYQCSSGSTSWSTVDLTSFSYQLNGNNIAWSSLSFSGGNGLNITASDPIAPYALFTGDLIYSYDFTITSVSIGEEDNSGLLSGILGWIKNIYNSITGLPQNIANKISGFFDNVVNAVTSLGEYLINGIKGLFVPSQEDIVATKEKWEQLLSDRFGAVYDSASIIDDFAAAFTYSNTKETVNFPEITVNLSDTPFTFGGWEIDVIPDGFSGIIETLKLIVSVACTFLFVNGMKKRLEDILR